MNMDGKEGLFFINNDFINDNVSLWAKKENKLFSEVFTELITEGLLIHKRSRLEKKIDKSLNSEELKGLEKNENEDSKKMETIIYSTVNNEVFTFVIDAEKRIIRVEGDTKIGFLAFDSELDENLSVDNLKQDLLKYGFSSIEEYFKIRVFPHYQVERILHQSVYKDYYEEITDGLKKLEKKLNKVDIVKNEEITITSDDAHALRLFFRFANEDKKCKYLTSFRNAWLAGNEIVKKIEVIIYLFLMFFPININIKEIIKEINSIKENSNTTNKDICSLFNYRIDTDKPLKMTLRELYYSFKAIFPIYVSEITLQTYCKEMNISLRKVGQRKTSDYANFEHPFLDADAKKKFLEIVAEETKIFAK